MRLFISHTDSDSGWVERELLPALAEAGLECHHEALFSLGKPRLLEFEEAIRQSDRILLICSPAYFSDESLQIVDLLAARHGEEVKSWPVVPIIRHAFELPLRLRILESLDATDEASWPDALTRLCNEFKVDTPPEPKKRRCPYPGMKPFERDSEFPFYGRQEEVGEIIERLRLHPFLALIGASGSGKSSLVHAGLIPELNRTQLLGEGDWLTTSFRPSGPSEGNHDQTLVSRLEAHLGGQVEDAESAKVSVESLLKVARVASPQDAKQLLLVVDQFEEVYTLQNERDEKYRLNKEDADRFQRALLTLAEVPGCYVVLTVRADFFGDLMGSPIWDKGVKDHRFELNTLGDEGMRQAIVQPALDQDVCIDQVLVERLLSEAGSEPGILPFLQETLVLLWGKLRWRYLSALDYESMVKGRRAEFRSGLEVAMAQRADAAFSSLPDDEHRLVARRIMLRLVQFGEGRLHTRRQQTVAQLSSAHSDQGIFDATLTHLTEKRLLTIGDARPSGGNKNDTENQDEKTSKSDQCSVDIAHDKLITGWPTLSDDEKGWIAVRRKAEETRRDLEAKVERWVNLGRKRFGGGLLDKIELAEYDKWIKSGEAAEMGEVPELDQLQKSSRNWVRLQQGLLAAIPILVFVAMGFWIWGLYGIAAKERERSKAAGDLAVAEFRTGEEVRRRRELARASFQSIADSLSTDFRLLRAEGLLDDSKLSAFRARLIDETGQQIQAVTIKVQDDEDSLAALGKTYIGLAWDTYEQGAQVEAIKLYSLAIDVYQHLQELAPNNFEYQLEEAFCFNNQGWSYGILRQPQEVDRVNEKALEIRKRSFEQHPDEAKVIRALAVSYGNICNRLWDKGRRDDAFEMLSRATSMFRQVRQLEPNNGHHGLNLSHQLNDQGDWYRMIGDVANSLRSKAECLKLREQLVNQYESDTSGISRDVFVYWLARSYAEKGRALIVDKSPKRAEEALQQAITKFEELVENNAENKRARVELGQAQLALVDVFAQLNQTQQMGRQFEIALDQLKLVVDSDANNVSYQEIYDNAKKAYEQFLNPEN
ncbi:MAG: toll/interleukin-1 receptor domain-containing protein [Planctomycetota bacterium]